MEFLDIWNKAVNGPEKSEKSFDMTIYKKALELKRKYDIVFDKSYGFRIDKSMARDLYNAGLELFLELGCYCVSTKRIIKLSEEEVKNELKIVKKTIKIGKGRDEVEIGGERKVAIIGGPCACPVSEEIFLDVMFSYANDIKVDGVMPGKLTRVKGLEISSRTPIEMLSVREEASLTRAAIEKANRPGMPILGITSVSSEASNFSHGSDGLRDTDLHEIDPINELKVDMETLKRILFCKRNNLPTASVMCPIVGGFAGGPEETAIVSVAEALQGFTIIGAHVFILGVNDINTGSGTDSKSLWVSGSVLLALKEMLSLPVGTLIWAAAGPCTEMVLYEIVTKSIIDSACGSNVIVGTGCTRGRLIDCYTGMEAKIMAEAVQSAQRLRFDDVIEVSRILLNNYEKKLLKREIPQPKSFKECYFDGKPSKEYIELWEAFKKKVLEIGLEMES